MRERVKIADFNHQWVEDILYFEGPLLSLLKASTSKDFFYYWCGVLDKKNQWLAFEVTREQIQRYKNLEMTLLQIVKAQPHVYLVFIDAEQHLERVWKYTLDDLPTNAFPSEDSYFDPEICVAEQETFLETPSTYAIKVDGDNWFIDDLIRIPRTFQQLYAFLYTLRHVHKPSVRANAAEIFRQYPWFGGFSRVNFYQSLRRVIPSMHEAKVTRLAMASEGEFRFELLVEAAEDVRAAVDTACANADALHELDKQVNAIIRDHKLAKVKGEQAHLYVGQNVLDVLAMKVDQIALMLGLQEHVEDLRRLAGNDLVAAKILLSFYTRVARFAEFQASGKIAFE